MFGYNYFGNTDLLDFDHSLIKELVAKKEWKSLEHVEKVRSIYNYVRNEILFGYNKADDIPASQVLKEGIGQSNTKAILLMTLLRAVGVRNRIHGCSLRKQVQKGCINGLAYRLCAPQVLHSWVEVSVDKQWYSLDGVILDHNYLRAVQRKYDNKSGPFCGYGICTDQFENPVVEFNNNDTYIQRDGLLEDFGIYDTPETFYLIHLQKNSSFRKLHFKHVMLKKMNENIRKIRNIGIES